MNRLKKRVREHKYRVGWDNPDNDGRLIYPYVHYLRRDTMFNGRPVGRIDGAFKRGIEKPHSKREDFEKYGIGEGDCAVFGNI